MDKEWYVVRVQSGREDTIKENLERRIKLIGMDQYIARIVVPSERVSEMKGGKTRISKRKMYPGYILVEMEPNDEAWFAIRETPGIGDFIGAHGRPTPMSKEEVAKILDVMERQDEKPKLEIKFSAGDNVKIKEGPFENFTGVVQEVVPAKGIVKVMLTIFGRSTQVELEYWQVENL
ncbi:MAG: transcription termination/antitermination factor NusG [Planctomycetes bacterium]|nr:transcription termination/antitermination factor NusG [Planctomycetota bacterium]